MGKRVKIDARKGYIQLVDDYGLLKGYHKSQMGFWGFKGDSSSFRALAGCAELRSILARVVGYFRTETIPYELEAAATHLLDTMAKEQARCDARLAAARHLKERNADSSPIAEVRAFLSKHISRVLKVHQERALSHLLTIGSGANFSVPGSGKTTVVLCAFEHLRLAGSANVLFVVGPPSCFGPWKHEYRQVFGREPAVSILAGTDRTTRQAVYESPVSDYGPLFLTTYHTLLNDSAMIETFLSRSDVSAYFVLDEAHYVKQLQGKWAEAALNVGRLACARCVLTGTPMPRSHADVFNLVDFLWPDCDLIDSETRTRIVLHEESGNHERARELLKDKLYPLFYRVTKNDLQLSPPIFHEPIVVEMNPNERLVYDAIITRIRRFTEREYLLNIEFVDRLRKARMMRLRQCTSNVGLLLTAIGGYDEDLLGDEIDLARIIARYEEIEAPAKIMALRRLIRAVRERGEKVVVWSNFVGTLKLIRHSLIQDGHCCKLIYGAVPVEHNGIRDEETRERIRDEFADPRSGLDILIANPAACAESVSLHKTCHYAVYYDLSYNCGQYLQSLDRIHRVGGSEEISPHYFFLQYRNTVDADIMANLQAKARRMYEAMEDDYAIQSMDMFDDTDEILSAIPQ